MIKATDINYLRTSSINIGRFKSSHSTISDAPSIIDIINDDIDSTITKAPQDQYSSFKKSIDPVNANVEAALSYNNKEYHTIDANIKASPSNNNKKYDTTIKDYLSDEKQSDHENVNKSDNENATDLSYHLTNSLNIPLRIIDMNSEFEKLNQYHIAWPQPTRKEIAKKALAEF
ncbi:2796_t:CDS:2 [Scutellospora calospora]|uniref:2796_t:CDS:1 n=1 Tax=Scutellospora calospora TaxID=85575 RepID=A0ACA9JXD8_9GLOM|nr:2796_t:CDS:2 [Scutellospora calospora]